MSEVERRTYHTLDGMRGLAALLVVSRHMDYAFAPLVFDNSFLAVDLFFVLSGFVIACAYDRRLADKRLMPRQFIVLRFIRLWPLYLLGTVLGLVIVYARMKHGRAGLDPETFWAIVPFTLVMIPSVFTNGFYPGSAVAWSLLFEMVVNIAYALTFRWVRTPHLLAVIAVSGIGVVAASLSEAGLGNGWMWSTAWVGLARVGFSFPVGILIYRYRDALPRVRIPAWAVLVLLAVVLTAPIPAALNIAYLDIAVLILLPALVAAAMQNEPSRRVVGVFSFLGVTSYAIYMLHPPLLIAAELVLGKFGVRMDDYNPWTGLGALVLIVIAAWLADNLYDTRLRGWLTRLYGSYQRRAAARAV